MLTCAGCRCSQINERNRRRDLEDAEKACMREMAERRKAVADPFTRRRCLPTLVTKVYLLLRSSSVSNVALHLVNRQPIVVFTASRVHRRRQD